MRGALDLLRSVGFREEEGVYILPLDANINDLDARKLEFHVGLDLIRKRIAADEAAVVLQRELALKSAKGAGKGTSKEAAAAKQVVAVKVASK